MKTPYLTALLLLPALACGSEGSSPPPPVATPLPSYAPPADRLDPATARTLDNAAFAALGAARTGPDRPGAPVPSTAEDRFVAPEGDDAAAGTEAAPWQTLQHAADQVAPDTTVWVADGDYVGGLRLDRGGAPGAYVVFRNLPGAHPRLLGGGDFTAVVQVEASYVVVRGFEITGHDRGVSETEDSIGVRVEPAPGGTTNVWILDNVIRGIGPGVVDEDACYYNGHGILAEAEGDALTNLVIEGNELFDLYVGHSECLVVNGNVSGFRITQNYVHDVNNIAIDIIGYENNDRETTRDGLIADNVVLDASNYWPYCSRGNCAYPRGDESSDGIYVDGGADLVIEHNVVGRADHGIELQSENGELIRNVEVRNNVVFNSYYKNFTLGDHDNSREYDNLFFDDPRLASTDKSACD